MTITEINEDNIFRYTDLIPAGLLGEPSREYCGGLAGDDDENDEPAASIVWEIRGVEDDNVPVEAEILWFEVSDGAEGLDPPFTPGIKSVKRGTDESAETFADRLLSESA